jgi:hypothetical protein
MKTKLMDILLNLLFLRFPMIVIGKDEEKLFNHLFQEACSSPDKLIAYNLQIPKYKFLHYLSQNKQILLHGSNNKGITAFEPFAQTLFNGQNTKAIFATKDPIWSSFYAVFNRKSLIGNFRNGAISASGKQNYHFYSLTRQTIQNEPWISGIIYILPEDSFTHVGKGIIQFDEWISKEAVEPLAKLEVKPEDFYFLNKVAYHHTDESIIKSWLLYKMRILIRRLQKK